MSSIASRPPVGGPSAWPIRDETITFYDVVLERGDHLDRVDMRYRLEGTLNAARDNVVVVVHALTGTTHASDWWKGVIGANAAIDPTKHAVLCANLLGGCDGTTGPTNENPEALPPVSTRDQAALLARLLDALGVGAPLLICGGSLGGMVTLEFAASFPSRAIGGRAGRTGGADGTGHRVECYHAPRDRRGWRTRRTRIGAHGGHAELSHPRRD